MVGWGLASMATMFVTGATSFYLLRLLLGVLEAGFFPGAILYLTYWFPNRVRGQITGLFYLGVPLALIFGRAALRISAGDASSGQFAELAVDVSGGRLHGGCAGVHGLLVSGQQARQRKVAPRRREAGADGGAGE